MAEPVSRTFPALPSALYEVRKFVREQCEEAGLSPAGANDVVLAVSEACANAVLHSGSAGTIFRASATTPRSAIWQIGASGSLLIAMIRLASFMPTWCCVAPEMPAAM